MPKTSSKASDERRLTAKESASAASAGQASAGREPTREKLTRKRFETELLKLQRELVIMQEYVRAKGVKVVVIFEGRDAAGKGGVIKRIAERTNPVFVVLSRCPRPPSARRRSGTSSGTWRTCPPPGKSSCSIAPGTTAPASSG